MTERPVDSGVPTGGGKRRRPGAGPVLWGSIALFAVMFALLTQQLSASQTPAPRPVLVRKVLKRRVITTFVPTPGRASVSTSGSPAPAAEPAQYAPITTAAS
ncbi:MAG TPA: hypothetical protein VH476_03475 [Solirubrobacterales bacterium]